MLLGHVEPEKEDPTVVALADISKQIDGVESDLSQLREELDSIVKVCTHLRFLRFGSPFLISFTLFFHPSLFRRFYSFVLKPSGGRSV